MRDFHILKFDEKPYLYVNVATDYDQLTPVVAAAFSTLADFLRENHITPAGDRFTYFSAFPGTEFRMRVCYLVERKDLAQAQGDVLADILPAGRAIHSQITGHYSDLPSVYAGMVEHCRSRGLILDEATWQVMRTRLRGILHETLVYECHQASMS